jgi:hypothetical protein
LNRSNELIVLRSAAVSTGLDAQPASVTVVALADPVLVPLA